MIAESLISNQILPLRTSDKGEDALAMMDDFYVRHLPIVNNEQLLGLISDDDILEFDPEEPIGSYRLSLYRPYIHTYDHVYEVMRQLASHNLTLIPVIDGEDNYQGVITQEDLLKYFANTGSFSESGSIMVLEINKRDYSMVEISRIIESEGASILSSFITSQPDSLRMELTLKINKQNIQSVIATFQRFDYSIKATFNEAEYYESLKERYDSLMSYLNV
ncbi:MAG: CBS domain-containing protein [Bacteroidota bacterium]